LELVPFAARIDYARNIVGEIAPRTNIRRIQINSVPRSEIKEKGFILDTYVGSLRQLSKACNHDDRNRQRHKLRFSYYTTAQIVSLSMAGDHYFGLSIVSPYTWKNLKPMDVSASVCTCT